MKIKNERKNHEAPTKPLNNKFERADKYNNEKKKKKLKKLEKENNNKIRQKMRLKKSKKGFKERKAKENF